MPRAQSCRHSCCLLANARVATDSDPESIPDERQRGADGRRLGASSESIYGLRAGNKGRAKATTRLGSTVTKRCFYSHPVDPRGSGRTKPGDRVEGSYCIIAFIQGPVRNGPCQLRIRLSIHVERLRERVRLSRIRHYCYASAAIFSVTHAPILRALTVPPITLSAPQLRRPSQTRAPSREAGLRKDLLTPCREVHFLVHRAAGIRRWIGHVDLMRT